MKEGLRKSFWKGRLEIIQKDPLVIVDGAHNVEGMKSLVQFIKPIKCKKVLLLGTAEDKEISKMLKLIVPLVEKVVLTQGNFKPASLKLLEKEVKKYNKEVYLCPDIKEAINFGLSLTNKGEMLLISGSLYLVGDVLAHRNLFK